MKLNDIIHVNIHSLANVKAARDAVINGRKVKIVPSATLPDDVIMNGIKYPADEIEKSYATLNRTPAPYGHPMIKGRYVSAFDPEAVNHFYIGAYNDNARRENGRVFIDKIIDVVTAGSTERGQEVLNAIESGDAIHTSTGLTGQLFEAEGEDHEFVIRNISFDHDAILLNEEGAATPAQGVGMFVNSKGDEMEVINSSADLGDLDLAVHSVYRAFEGGKLSSLLNRIKALMELSSDGEEVSASNSATKGDADMADDNRLDELAAEVKTIGQSVTELVNALPGMIEAGVKPAIELANNLKSEAEAKEKTELDDLAKKLVNAKLLDEDDLGELTLNMARALAKKLPTKKGAVTVNTNTADDEDDEDGLADYDLNNVIDLANKEA